MSKLETTESVGNLLSLLKRGNLSAEELSRIFSYYKETKNKELRDAIVTANDGLVLFMLGRYKGSPNYEDILQEGRIGLLMAVQKYDPSMGTAFSTYACHYIWGYSSRYANTYNTLHIPMYIIEKINAIKKIKSNATTLTEEEIAKEMGISITEVRTLDSYAQKVNVASLEAIISSDESGGDSVLADVIVSDIKTPEEVANEEEIKRIIMEMIKKVAPIEKHQMVIKEYFGIDCCPRTFREIGLDLNISYQRVSQIVQTVIRKLREPFRKAEFRRKLGVSQDMSDRDILHYLFNERSVDQICRKKACPKIN